MTEFTRNITISSNNLGKGVTLLLAFDKPTGGLYVDKFPVVWKVSEFGSSGPYSMMATYKSQLSFSKPQVVNDQIVADSTWVNINTSQKTDLVQPSPRVYRFTPPVPGVVNAIQATNRTGAPQDISLGFENTNKMLPPIDVLYFNPIGDKTSVTPQFTPVLRAYVTSDYKESQILRRAIQTEAIREIDLSILPELTSWVLTSNPATGRYALERASMI